MPGARCTRSRAFRVESTRVSHHGRTGIIRHSRTRMVLTVSFALSLVTGLCCHHRPRESPSRELDASVGASGPHDFAVRGPSAPKATPGLEPAETLAKAEKAPFVKKRRRVHRIPHQLL